MLNVWAFFGVVLSWYSTTRAVRTRYRCPNCKRRRVYMEEGECTIVSLLPSGIRWRELHCRCCERRWGVQHV